MIKEFYLTKFEQNILKQFNILDDSKMEQSEYLKNIRHGTLEKGFNGFIWYGEIIKFYQENREIIQDIYRQKKFLMPKKYIENMNATKEEIEKVLFSSFLENETVSAVEDWESQIVTFLVWFAVEQSVCSIKEKIYTFGE